jgi:hypothetical protein
LIKVTIWYKISPNMPIQFAFIEQGLTVSFLQRARIYGVTDEVLLLAPGTNLGQEYAVPADKTLVIFSDTLPEPVQSRVKDAIQVAI